ncbi:TerD family protein [Streptomyces sp. NPDC050504]|uniref:TerD family protein n=1 Tax=Streptomyces sp. NPDC050504 TaxID=3365618 RepID=UPI003791FA7D
MTHITKGANTPVPSEVLRIAVCRRHVQGAPAVDASALLLGADGRVRGDADMVFHDQPHHPSGAVRHLGGGAGDGQLAEWLELDLARVEPGVDRVVVAAACDGGTFGAVPGLYVQLLTGAGARVALYAVDGATTETAFVLGEVYRRGGGWRFRAVGQGYASGLAGLATDFGVVVEGGPQPPVPVRHAPPVPAQPAPAPHAPVVPAVPHAFGPEFPAFVRRGYGSDVLTVDAPVPAGPVIVEAWHEDDGYFAVETLNHRNKTEDLLFNTTQTAFRGRALVQYPADRPLRLKIEADNDWTLLVQPLSVARRADGGVRGRGPEVLLYGGPVADLDVVHEGDEDGGGYFGLWSADRADRFEDRRDLLVNETDRFRLTVPLPDGPLVLAVEADGGWSLAPRPVPGAAQGSPAAAAPVGPAAASVVGGHRGGPGTVTLVNPNPGVPALLEYAVRGHCPVSGYEIKLLDEYDDEEPFLRGTDHGSRGRTLLFRKGEPEARLRIEDATDWDLQLLTADRIPPLAPVQGSGSAVFRYAGPPALLGLGRTTADDAPLSTHTVQHGGKRVVSADTQGRRRPAVGPLWVSGAGFCYVQVGAPETTGWQLAPTDLAAAPAFDGTVSGHGYGVVRNTGPEAEMMLTHERRGALDVPVVWALDERLEPVRRISVGSGLHTFPHGFLQIRTGGPWNFEVR